MSATLEDQIELTRENVVGRRITEDTFYEYERWIRRFEAWYDGDDPTVFDLEQFDALLYDPDKRVPWADARTPESYAYSSRIQAISAVLFWIRRQYGVQLTDQPDDIVYGDEPDFRPKYLSRARVQDILAEADDACSNPGCRTALMVSYDAILRAVELVNLTRDDFNAENGELHVDGAKGSRSTTLTLNDRTTEALEAHLETHDHRHIFTNAYGDPWTRNSWSSHVSDNHVEEGSHVWGRHTPIIHMLNAGTGFGEVFRRARHKQPTTTARYARYVGTGVPDWVSGDDATQ